jgi:hypothetical protein
MSYHLTHDAYIRVALLREGQRKEAIHDADERRFGRACAQPKVHIRAVSSPERVCRARERGYVGRIGAVQRVRPTFSGFGSAGSRQQKERGQSDGKSRHEPLHQLHLP